MAWRYRMGSPWRDVPAEFGAWQSHWDRHRRWSTDRTYEQMLAAILALLPADDPDLLAFVAVNSTVVRAHQHAAGARHAGPSTLWGLARTTRNRRPSRLTTHWDVPAAA